MGAERRTVQPKSLDPYFRMGEGELQFALRLEWLQTLVLLPDKLLLLHNIYVRGSPTDAKRSIKMSSYLLRALPWPIDALKSFKNDLNSPLAFTSFFVCLFVCFKNLVYLCTYKPCNQKTFSGKELTRMPRSSHVDGQYWTQIFCYKIT